MVKENEIKNDNRTRKKLNKYFDKGYLILIWNTHYVDNEVKKIYEENNELIYDSKILQEHI